MAEMGILGRRVRTEAFSALGVRSCYVVTARQAEEAFDRMVRENCAVIFVDAEWREVLRERALRCRDRILPAVLFLSEDSAAEEDPLQEAVRRALGTDAV